ncbi:MAG: hypothetical protein WBW33_16900 [Bryobacteraceae bacterium]
MSSQNGDRARSDKQTTKRRLRRLQLRAIRKSTDPAVVVPQPAPIKN